MVKHEPEVRRANAKRYVDACNSKIHEAPWTTGRTQGLGAGGLYEALELAALAYKTLEDVSLFASPLPLGL
jgi:hypothetical protein